MRNGEGYSDPTASRAEATLRRVLRAWNALSGQVLGADPKRAVSERSASQSGKYRDEREGNPMKDKDAPRTISQSCAQARAILRDMEQQGRLLRKEVVDARKSGYEDGYKAGLEDGTRAAREEARRAMARAKREWAQKYATDVQTVLDDNPTEVGKWARAHGYVRG